LKKYYPGVAFLPHSGSLLRVSACKLESLTRWISRTDGLGKKLARWSGGAPAPAYGEGVSVIVPAAAHAHNLPECLESVRAAAAELLEPVEVIVVATGDGRAACLPARRAHPAVNWQFHAKPLESTAALAAGLRKARFDWVYLLKGDTAMARNALSLLAPSRGERSFAVAAEDWTLPIESGLAAIHHPHPPAALLQTRLLRWFLEPAVYDLLSWDYLEWRWRASKVGYDWLTCPVGCLHAGDSGARNDGEAMLRNRLLFQLRNFTAAGSLERVVKEVTEAPDPVIRFFLQRETLWQITRGRLWNHRAPFTDDHVLSEWAPAAVGAD
jgi:hypothetical protein